MRDFGKLFIKKISEKSDGKKRTLNEKAGRFLVTFLVVMLICTLISRAADSIALAKVSVGKIRKSELSFSTKCSGVIESNIGGYMKLYPGVHIEQVYVKLSDKVKEHQKLLRYDIDDLKEKREKSYDELKKMELNARKENASSKLSQIQDSQSETEVSSIALKKARSNVSKIEKDIKIQKEQIREEKRNEYEKAKNTLQNETARLNEMKAEKDVQRTDIIAQKKQVEEAEGSFEEAQTIYMQIKKGTYNFDKELSDKYSELEAARQAAEDEQSQLEKAEKQKKESEEKRSEQDKINGDIKDIDSQIAQIDIESARRGIEELDKMIEEDGYVYSKMSGVISQWDVNCGSVTTGEEKILFSGKSKYFKAVLSKDSVKNVKTGDKVKIRDQFGKKRVTATVEEITQAPSGQDSQQEDGMVQIMGNIKSNVWEDGTSVDIEIVKESKMYNATLPLQAIHMVSDNTGYVYVVNEQNSVLGKGFIVSKEEVQIENKDYKNASVVGSIKEDDRVIVSSSKDINEGDRIRLEEEDEAVSE